MLTGLTVTFSFHALLENFNDNCIFGANLVFVHRDEVANSTVQSLLDDASNRTQQPLNIVSGQNYPVRIRNHFEPNGTPPFNPIANEKDFKFFVSRKYDNSIEQYTFSSIR